NSTLVFDVELLDIKPAPKADAQPEAAGDAKAADAKADAKK
ncbi:TPA: FKBP-type peptidyl-prolyl cis-trans isomerase FkpA, partial [Klebsiella pneumoniae]|nr:FKBP-type peptidyl-prolyl cis-trans isomerase FkpA [Klebsiella pneumoniae]